MKKHFFSVKFFLQNYIYRFASDYKGVAAVELALVLPVLLMIIFTIVEIGFMYHVYMLEQNIAQEALRYAITGNAYADINPKSLARDEFIKEVSVTKMGSWIKYENQMQVETAIINSSYDVNGQKSSALNFGNNGAGVGGNFVVYRLTYDWKFFSPFLQSAIGDKDGKFRMNAIVAAKNEDF